MGRRKIEIKAIKDDRNRSVTFLKRKAGLFKKAHELSVLCSVDVAVFVFGSNKKLYEYSSSNMGDLMTRHQYHGGISEHKGPADFNGGNDDDEDDEGDGTPPPRGAEGVDMENQMMPPQFHGQAPFPQIRQHTMSASPPIGNGAPFQGHHPAHGPPPRSLTPQGHPGSRPGSRNDMRRLGPNMVPHAVGPHGPPGAHPGITYMPTPPIYNPPVNQPGPMPAQAPGYSYPPQHQAQPQQRYMEERRPSAPPGYAPTPPHGQPPATRMQLSPHPPAPQQLPPQPVPQIISPPPQSDRRIQDPPMPPPVEPKREQSDRPQPPLLNTESAIKKLPSRKSHSIFTPIEENRSILSQHLASFSDESHSHKSESAAAAAAANHAHLVDGSPPRRNGTTTSPRPPHRLSNQEVPEWSRHTSVSSGGADVAHTPPSRSNSLKIGGPGGASRPRGPRLTVQIPDGESEPGSATGESNSPRNPADRQSQAPQRHNSHSSIILPPPSPSGPALLSAGATGPTNPFARPVPQRDTNETPASALPSRFMNQDLISSPSAFYSDWGLRGNDGNSMRSPLNFATPTVGTGPSFLRDDHHGSGQHNQSGGSEGAASGSVHAPPAATSDADNSGANPPGLSKRKSFDHSPINQTEGQDESNEAKRVKTER